MCALFSTKASCFGQNWSDLQVQGWILTLGSVADALSDGAPPLSDATGRLSLRVCSSHLSHRAFIHGGSFYCGRIIHNWSSSMVGITSTQYRTFLRGCFFFFDIVSQQNSDLDSNGELWDFHSEEVPPFLVSSNEALLTVWIFDVVWIQPLQFRSFFSAGHKNPWFSSLPNPIPSHEQHGEFFGLREVLLTKKNQQESPKVIPEFTLSVPFHSATPRSENRIHINICGIYTAGIQKMPNYTNISQRSSNSYN